MAPYFSKRDGNWKARKYSATKFSSPQVTFPNNLPAWANTQIPRAPNSAPKPQSGKHLFDSAKKGITFDGRYEAKEKEDRLQSQKNSISRSSPQVKTIRTGDKFQLANEARTAIGNEDANAELNSSPLTMEDGSSERKERLKDATASQKQDKSTGKKKNKEKGGSENVFNARSPTQEYSRTVMHDKSTPTQARNRANVDSSPAFSRGSSTKAIPLRYPSIAPTRNEQKNSQPTQAHQSSQRKSAAATEAQLQADLLRRSGHREFSSHVFDESDEDKGEPKSHEGLSGSKKKDKKRKVEDFKLDPVEAEIAKQQVNYNEYMSKRMKENPDHYFEDGVDVIHELTSEGGSDHERIHDRSATKKDKDRRKRMRSREDDSIEEDAAGGGGRKKARVAKSINEILPAGLTATYVQHQKPISLQQLRNAPPMTVITENASANADFIKTLKSLWAIIPKALLHTTMTHLNKANRRSLDAKLKLCQEGKQTNPHIRIVTRTNENGDEVELLEEYGKISEPDPHTMSSELTLLTAAKDLIVLLSGQRVGLNLSSTASPSREGETKSVGTSSRGQSTQGCVGEVSALEEELTRIAGEYQKEIDKLREENRDLSAKLKKSKR